MLTGQKTRFSFRGVGQMFGGLGIGGMDWTGLGSGSDQVVVC